VAEDDTLFELLISDRLKGALPQGPLNYVLTQEGEGWYTSEKVASLVDVFVNHRATIAGQKATDGNSVGCCVISCQIFVKSELLLDFTYLGCRGLEKIGWHFFRTQ